ncbi:MAG TPA: hypothetical protein VFD27_12320 [Chthoniobacteraceae bacterium]|nr:hypothetical protein [Chthoniobacteraceae bacterium]
MLDEPRCEYVSPVDGGRCTLAAAHSEMAHPIERGLKVQDSDTGESCLHVVRVPGGFSLQMGMNGGEKMPDDFISIIIDQANAGRIAKFFRDNS